MKPVFVRLLGGCLYVLVHAIAMAQGNDLSDTLPDLPESTVTPPAHFSLDNQAAAIAYASRDEHWSARTGNIMQPGSSLTMDYGVQMNRQLGFGGAFSRDSTYSNAFVSGLFAPARDMRLRLAGGQLRAADNDPLAAGERDRVLQNSYLVDLRKHWKNGPVSRLGIAAYAIEAQNMNAGSTASDGARAPERLDGVALNLALRPTLNSRIEMQQHRSYLSYAASVEDQQLLSNGVRYMYQLGDCAQLQGRYSDAADSSAVSASVAMRRWNVGVARSHGTNSADVSFQFSYRVPLGKSSDDRQRCSEERDVDKPFQALARAAADRPSEFLQAPLDAYYSPSP